MIRRIVLLRGLEQRKPRASGDDPIPVAYVTTDYR